MANDKNINITTIFIDCFSTIIFRNKKKNEVFKLWCKELSAKHNVSWKLLYKTYKRTNFNLCFKKLFSTFTLQEHFDVVLNKMIAKLTKKFTWLNSSFIEDAKNLYYKNELESFTLNSKIIEFLKSEKTNGKKIYLVSDFYCKSDVITYWFTALGINTIFDKIYSSCDFNKEKATTKIYKHLLKELKLNPKNVIMYGDNLWSDVLMAKKCGINAQRIKRPTTKEK